jgi:Putative adhesin
MKNSRSMVCCFIICLLAGLMSPKSTPALEGKERHRGRVRFDVSYGVRLEVDNRTTGRITVQGWDRDVVEARALSTRGDEVVVMVTVDGASGKQISISADYANLEDPTHETGYVSDPPQVDGGNLKVHLEVNVPRYVELNMIEVWRSDVQVTGVDTLVAVSSDRSSVILKDVGGAEVRNRSGNVEIDGVKDLSGVSTSSGAIRVSRSKTMVRAVSIGGPIEIKCSTGRIDVSNTEAPIELANIDGDVDAVATNSSVRYTGKLRADGRYYLKSMSGRVEMLLPNNPAGFNATLSSYRGAVESDFKLITKQSDSDAAHNRRRAGIFGNGKAQIILDSFEGLVRLTKVDSSSIPSCK